MSLPVGKYRNGRRILIVSPVGPPLELTVCPDCNDEQWHTGGPGKTKPRPCPRCGGWGGLREP